MEDFSTTDQIQFYQTLKRLLTLGHISIEEMETLLNKIGLSRIGDGIYHDIIGAVIKMK